MRPILVRFGDGFFLHSYGVFLAIGFVVGIYLAAREAERHNDDVDAILDLCTWILVAAVAGSRLFHVVVFHEQFTSGPHPLLRVWEGRGVLLGTTVAAAALVWWIRLRVGRRGATLESHWPLTALAVLTVALAQIIARSEEPGAALGAGGAMAAGAIATALFVGYARATGRRLPGSPHTIWDHPDVWAAAIGLALASAALHQWGGGESGATAAQVFAVTAGSLLIGVPLVARRLQHPARRAWLRVGLCGVLALTLGWIQHVAFHYPSYRRDNLVETFRIWNGGLTYYGGFLGAVAFSLFYCRARGLSFLRVADITSPSIMLGVGFGRLGCAAAGCCHGKVAASFPLAVIITAKDSLSPRFVPLYPTQVVSSICDVLIFLFLIWLRPRLRARGQLFYAMLAVYGVFRFTVEFWRDDPRGFVAFGGLRLAESQVVSIPLFALGAAAFAWSWYRSSPAGALAQAAPEAGA